MVDVFGDREAEIGADGCVHPVRQQRWRRRDVRCGDELLPLLFS